MQPNHAGNLPAHGAISLRVIKPRAAQPKVITLERIRHWAFPQRGLPDEINRWRKDNLSNIWRGMKPIVENKLFGTPTIFGALYLARVRPLIADRLLGELSQEWGRHDGPWRLQSFPAWLADKGFPCERADFGLASLRVVTTAGVNFIVDAFQNTVEVENLKFHGVGTGTNAEASGDTALQTELTTQYNPDSTRATGSLTEGASANIFRTVGTNTFDASAALTEHGIFSQAATGGGTLLDRSVYSAQNVANGDSQQATYDLTISAGG